MKQRCMITQNANEYEIFFISFTPLRVFFNIAVGSAGMDIFDISNSQQPTFVTNYPYPTKRGRIPKRSLRPFP